MTGPASIAASLTASGDSLKSDEAAPSTPAAAIQSLHRCAGDAMYGIAGAAGTALAAGAISAAGTCSTGGCQQRCRRQAVSGTGAAGAACAIHKNSLLLYDPNEDLVL